MPQPKFEGWCSVDEYERWSAEVAEYDEKITAQVIRQIQARRRMKAMESIKQYLRILLWAAEWATVVFLGFGLTWFIWQIVDALPRFIEAWR